MPNIPRAAPLYPNCSRFRRRCWSGHTGGYEGLDRTVEGHVRFEGSDFARVATSDPDIYPVPTETEPDGAMFP